MHNIASLLGLPYSGLFYSLLLTYSPDWYVLAVYCSVLLISQITTSADSFVPNESTATFPSCFSSSLLAFSRYLISPLFAVLDFMIFYLAYITSLHCLFAIYWSFVLSALDIFSQLVCASFFAVYCSVLLISPIAASADSSVPNESSAIFCCFPFYLS